MRAQVKTLIAAVLGVGLLGAAGQVLACDHGCPPPPPPSPPHNPTPCNCGTGNININANVRAQAFAGATASAGATVYSGGYGNWSQTPGYPQPAGGLAVVTGDEFESYSERQSFTKTVIIQASCIDDTGVPHPASQLRKDRNIDNGYVGEIYRCIAGTHMQWVYADYDGRVSFDGGKTVSCNKNEALWFEKGALTCKVQIPQRQCNERSLLRLNGVGVKILTMTRTEMVSKQRSKSTTSVASTTMSFDGGVGGFVQ
ncbi:MAG TPA: hypothetical protein VG839_00050 [Asticcacaulis sp.]|nr:hypothetical protein [Asticcacaulis sp.]